MTVMNKIATKDIRIFFKKNTLLKIPMLNKEKLNKINKKV
jgi:hypothetical protein